MPTWCRAPCQREGSLVEYARSKHRIMGFTAVATVIASVTMSAAWGVVYDIGVATVSLQGVAESDFIPLGAVALFRCACAMIAFYTLLCVYCDHKGLELRYHEAQRECRKILPALTRHSLSALPDVVYSGPRYPNIRRRRYATSLLVMCCRVPVCRLA